MFLLGSPSFSCLHFISKFQLEVRFTGSKCPATHSPFKKLPVSPFFQQIRKQPQSLSIFYMGRKTQKKRFQHPSPSLSQQMIFLPLFVYTRHNPPWDPFLTSSFLGHANYLLRLHCEIHLNGCPTLPSNLPKHLTSNKTKYR